MILAWICNPRMRNTWGDVPVVVSVVFEAQPHAMLVSAPHKRVHSTRITRC